LIYPVQTRAWARTVLPGAPPRSRPPQTHLHAIRGYPRMEVSRI